MSHPPSLQTTSSSLNNEALYLYIKAALALILANANQSLLYLISLIFAAQSARILTSKAATKSVTMDNDPQPVQEQKKEKALNELLTSSIVDIYIGPESTHWPLHERLLCYHSPFLSNIFYKDHDQKNQDGGKKSSGRKSYGFPDEEDHTFTLLVGWLYSSVVPPPKTEKDIGPLLDLYLLAQKLEMERLSSDVVDAAREFYHTSNTYPGLRRVQYIYANTDEDNEMREMMVSSVARQLATTQRIPAHWVSALQRNGQLAVDIIRSIQKWAIEEANIPDVRDRSSSSGRGRKNKSGFSAIVREADSMETDTTAVTGSFSMGSNLGVESIASEEPSQSDDKTSTPADSFVRTASEVGREVGVEAEYLTLSSLSLLQAQLKRPPDDFQLNDLQLRQKQRRPRRGSVTFKPEAEIMPAIQVSDEEDENEDKGQESKQLEPVNRGQDEPGWVDRAMQGFQIALQRQETLFLLFLWIIYLVWFVGWFGGDSP